MYSSGRKHALRKTAYLPDRIFSPVRRLTMWLLHTHVVYSYNAIVVIVVLYSECDHENNQSTHALYELYKNSHKNCHPLNILEAAYLLLLLFILSKYILSKSVTLSHGPKNTARGVRSLLGFNTYLILAQCEQVYLFLALSLKLVFTPICLYRWQISSINSSTPRTAQKKTLKNVTSPSISQLPKRASSRATDVV